MVVGFALVGGVITTGSPVSLEQTTPLARLVGEQDIIVVPADSEHPDMADLVEKLKADPGAVSWGGGSIGGFDHVLVGQIVKAVGRRSGAGELRRARRAAARCSPRRSAAT